MPPVVVIIILSIILLRLYQKTTNAVCKSTKVLHGKVAVVTGGTAGMGLEIAKDFARRGAKVIVGCPFEDEGEQARMEIIDASGNKNVYYKYLDLSSLQSVRIFANEILSTESRLDILVNNAGVGVPKDFVTRDGLSFIMQVNYFGHFLLSILLIPLLKKSGTTSDPSRIVNVSSILHYIGILGIKQLNRTDHMVMWSIYAKSKFCLVLFARELTKRMECNNVVINCVDPGAVGTRIFDSAGRLQGMILSFLSSTFYKTPWEGAQTTIFAALDEQVGQKSGEFYKNCARSKPVHWAYNEKLASRVFDKSLECVKLSGEVVF